MYDKLYLIFVYLFCLQKHLISGNIYYVYFYVIPTYGKVFPTRTICDAFISNAQKQMHTKFTNMQYIVFPNITDNFYYLILCTNFENYII